MPNHRTFNVAAAVGAVFVALVLSGPARAFDPTLVGDWTFDDGSGTSVRDASGNGNDGVIVGTGPGAPAWGSGAFSGALLFSGKRNAFVRVAASPSLNTVTSAMTISALVYPLDIWQPGANHTAYIAIAQRQWRETQHPDQFYLGYGNIGTTLYYKWHVGTAAGETTFYALPKDATAPRVGEWLVLTATYDSVSGHSDLYVDGTLVRETNAKGTIRLDAESLDRPFAIGAELNSPSIEATSGPFSGYVSEVRLYNRALTTDEVAALASMELQAR